MSGLVAFASIRPLRFSVMFHAIMSGLVAFASIRPLRFSVMFHAIMSGLVAFASIRPLFQYGGAGELGGDPECGVSCVIPV
jgi:hypothetical protein